MNKQITLDGITYDLVPVEKEVESGRVKEGELYWYVSSFLTAHNATESLSEIDDNRFYLGNYFKTTEQSEKHQEYLLAKMRINKFIKENGLEFEPDWSDLNQRKYRIEYNNSKNTYLADWYTLYQVLSADYFKSTEDARKVIDNCQADLDIIRTYKK